MKDQQLNMELALTRGYTKDRRYPGRVTRGNVVTIPKDYCNDVVASLEAQAAALEVNAAAYLKHLSAIVYGTTFEKLVRELVAAQLGVSQNMLFQSVFRNTLNIYQKS